MNAAIAASVVNNSEPFRALCVILLGGETTFTMRGEGRGSRNIELALGLALGGRPGIYALSAGKDVLDGSSRPAGAWIGPNSLSSTRAAGVNSFTSNRFDRNSRQVTNAFELQHP